MTTLMWPGIYVSAQIDIPAESIEIYQQRQQTLAEHRSAILYYLGWRRFSESKIELLEAFLFAEASRLEQTGPLLIRAKQFLKESGILLPADDTLRRLIGTQRQAARKQIFSHVADTLSSNFKEQLDELLTAGDKRLTPFQSLKEPPGKASPNAMLRLTTKLESIQTIGILDVDLSWLNNNYQRALTRYARRCSADRMRKLKEERRYTVLVCFLWQVYRDTIDQLVEMHHKLMIRIYNRAQIDIDEQARKQRRMIRSSLTILHTLGQAILDKTISDELLRQTLFDKVDKEELTTQMADIETWLTGKYSHVFNLVVERFSYIRQFAPTLLEHLDFHLEEGVQSTLVEAVRLLREMNEESRRKLPDDAPLDFIPAKLRPLVEQDGEVSKRAWECALLTVVRDEIKAGNLYVQRSKRFGRFDDFFMTDPEWENQREAFFKRAGLPMKADDVPDYLTQRLNQTYDNFLENLPQNSYATVGENGWQLSVDSSDKLDFACQQKLEKLQTWLADNMRTIKLPALLIEVDNELHVTHHFMTSQQQQGRTAQDVCTVLATIMAHGCNVGPYMGAYNWSSHVLNALDHDFIFEKCFFFAAEGLSWQFVFALPDVVRLYSDPQFAVRTASHYLQSLFRKADAEGEININWYDVTTILRFCTGLHADILIREWLPASHRVVKHYGIHALGQARIGRAVPPLLHLLDERDGGDPLVSTLSEALGIIASPPAVKALLRQTEPGKRVGLWYCPEWYPVDKLEQDITQVISYRTLDFFECRALGLKGITSFTDALYDACYSADPSARGAAALALARLGRSADQAVVEVTCRDASDPIEHILGTLGLLLYVPDRYAELEAGLRRSLAAAKLHQRIKPLQMDVITVLASLEVREAQQLAASWRPYCGKI